MLFLPAAALCCLCSALVATAAQLLQEQMSLTKRPDETDTLRCTVTGRCDKNQVYWYQKTDSDPLRVILRVDLTDGKVNSRLSHAHRGDFSASRKPYGCELVITKMKSHHSATYYCVCWERYSHGEERILQPEQKPTGVEQEESGKPQLSLR